MLQEKFGIRETLNLFTVANSIIASKTKGNGEKKKQLKKCKFSFKIHFESIISQSLDKLHCALKVLMNPIKPIF